MAPETGDPHWVVSVIVSLWTDRGLEQRHLGADSSDMGVRPRNGDIRSKEGSAVRTWMGFLPQEQGRGGGTEDKSGRLRM
jgi:hypothetical protein